MHQHTFQQFSLAKENSRVLAIKICIVKLPTKNRNISQNDKFILSDYTYRVFTVGIPGGAKLITRVCIICTYYSYAISAIGFENFVQ